MLCLHRLQHPLEPSTTRSPPQLVLKLKIGPLWKLAHVVEPAPTPVHTLRVLDEKNEAAALDGPFAETKP